MWYDKAVDDVSDYTVTMVLEMKDTAKWHELEAEKIFRTPMECIQKRNLLAMQMISVEKLWDIATKMYHKANEIGYHDSCNKWFRCQAEISDNQNYIRQLIHQVDLKTTSFDEV